MAYAAYTSVRRSSTSSMGSDYSDADAGGMGTETRAEKRMGAMKGTGAGADREYTKDFASPSSQPSVSATATPSPANFLSLADKSFTPLSMDSELFPDRDFDLSFGSSRKATTATTTTATGSPRFREQQRSTSPPATMAASGKGSSHAVTEGPRTRTKSRSRSRDAYSGLSLQQETLHAATGTTPATTRMVAAADEERNVSGARDTVDATTEMESWPRSGSHSKKSQKKDGHGTEAEARNLRHVGNEEEYKEDESDEVPPFVISPRSPRQRHAGSTPLWLDPLQVNRGRAMGRAHEDEPMEMELEDRRSTGTAAAAGAVAGASAGSDTTTDRNRRSDKDKDKNTGCNEDTGAGSGSVRGGASTSLQSPQRARPQPARPPIQEIQPMPRVMTVAAPLALRTKNINPFSTTDTGGHNTSFAAAAAITSPAASTATSTSTTSNSFAAWSPSTVLSAPAALARHISTSSLRSNSSLISQIQDSLQQQQQQQDHHSSSASTFVRPVAQPIVRTVSDSGTFTLKHPVPDLNCRSGAYTTNVAALEKSAERLSMTSSIEDAIRDLHGELKRSDSRRSSILAANLAASHSSVDESLAHPGPLRVIPPVASIVGLNNNARLGGYSPSGYVMSPNHSLTSRLRSGSNNSRGRPEIDVDAIVSRHGSGKGSTRSARSGKPSLAEIAESEPVALTGRVLDEADHAPIPVTADDDATIRRPNTNEENRGSVFNMLGEMDQHSGGLGLDFGGDSGRRDSDDRPPTPKSTSTFDHANAFGDFDGVHCQPEDLERSEFDSREQSEREYGEAPIPVPHTMPMPDIPEPQYEAPPPRMPRTNRHTLRPQSYFDELTGQEMLYYPARVPAMLNLPPKLSKKPKTEVRNARHSKVLQAMGHPGFGQAKYLPQDPEASQVRESKMWLPDPLAGHGMTSFGDDIDGQRSGDASLKEPAVDSHVPSEQGDPLLSGGGGEELEHMPQDPPPTQRRKSKMPRASQLPPQLRASAFFDLPSTTPQIEVKGGSAMATLDSILDASANAPVSAFTDHAFAGKLGNETYGPDKKKNRKSTATVLLPEEHVLRAASQKKTASLMPFSKKSDNGSRKNSMAGSREENQALSDHVDGKDGEKAEGEGSDAEEEEEEFDEFAGVLDGPPTTLLAELQLRKYHAKMRTQNPNRNIGQNGMHATLIELDLVAETQKKHREKKKIALAWEVDGAKEEDHSSDEDDVPLGVLYAGNPHIAEKNRPMGLMERRDLEENEPLSARRARLHGQEPPRTLAKQRSNFTLNAGLSQMRLNQMPSAEHLRPEEDSEDEATAGETLGERMRRLRAKDEAEHNNLPNARPVSRAFSAEILAQFGDDDEKKPGDKGKEKEAQPDEGEETLGQRRKRLQAEREAREQEMMLSGGPGPVEAEAPPLRKKHSLADVLGSHPIAYNPALDEQRRLEQEKRKVREQEAKMAAVRAQMPQVLTGPNTQRSGGYKNGAFNDATGGTGDARGLLGQPGLPPVNAGLGVSMGPGGWNRSSIAFSNYGGPLQQPMQQQPQRHSVYGHAGMAQMSQPNLGGYGGYTAGGMGGMNTMGGMSGMNPYGGGMGGVPMPMQPMGAGMGMQQGMAPMPMQQMQMPMQPGHNGQMQSIERWRQSVMY
ncbi:hypothetical protein CORC01_01512 [Colletotrichum orchidophilum]|uniref:Uncharacterized protein n=1 Tax=Colletotrichum orchidophilum TaxID=1209926 RepID=A0A1G4BPA2_9PEZI|nr:uncharacterized protein CORC01_01512 [Colletotrichum orchidophilum]OHF03128.1 hypothetical protein CORC01_01512 [Colletotrichum orchidophilum]